MNWIAQLSLGSLALIFAIAALVISLAGWRLATAADRLADATGWGEAMAGALLLGATTSLPGILTSSVTAFEGFAGLAISNALGGICGQTAFLAIADITYRKANLEHASASLSNILQCALLLTLLTLPILAYASPDWSIFGVHPASVALLLSYLYGLRLISAAHKNPTWLPQVTPETREDEPEAENQRMSLPRLWSTFVVCGTLVGVAGWVVAEAGMAITEKSGLSESAVGGIFTAVATSLPELITALAAVRQGALILAVGGIIGGNAFDTLFVATADIFYRDGSIYHAIGKHELFLMATALLLNSILLLGLLRREKRGIGGIGFESFLVLILYFGALAYLFNT